MATRAAARPCPSRRVVGKPIKFIGVGEKMDALEVYYPDRMASRILGMGDVLTLIERAEAALDQKKAAELEKKLRANKFDFEDYLNQMRQMRKMGPLEQILGMIPGMGALKDLKIDEKQLAHIEAMICSMTVQERREPGLINGSRRRRIAAGQRRDDPGCQPPADTVRADEKDDAGFTGGGGMPALPGMAGGRAGKHAGSNKKNKRKPAPGYKFPFGRG